MKAWYRRCFDSKPPNNPAAYCSGDPGVFHSRCQRLWTHVTVLGFPRTPNLVGAHPIYISHLIFVIDELNSIKTLCLMCCLCDFSFKVNAKSIGSLLIGTNDGLTCRAISRILS